MEAAVVAWRGQRRRGGGGGNVEEKVVAWRLGDFKVQRERDCFVFCFFNFIYLTNLTVKLLF